MDKCKNCGTEEQGYGTLLDKRGYCYKPSCQSCSYDEVEQQNSRLQSELDKQIKDNRKLVEVLKMYADGDFYEADVNLQTNPLTNREEVFSVDIIDNEGNIIYTKAQKVLKEIGEEE